MEIILIRHGRPINSANDVLNAAGFANWVKNYDHSVVSEKSVPCEISQNKYKGFHLISSDLPRAIHSCEIFSGHKPHQQCALFREMEVPRYKLPFTLKAWTWVYLNRFLWMLGKKGPFESYLEARIRAKKAAYALVEIANKQDKVVLFSHGYLILHMRKYLRRQGFTQLQKSNSYWGVSVFESAIEDKS